MFGMTTTTEEKNSQYAYHSHIAIIVAFLEVFFNDKMMSTVQF